MAFMIQLMIINGLEHVKSTKLPLDIHDCNQIWAYM